VSTPDPHDLRDARLDAAWRAASNEEPPAALDDAIRAAARREVNAGPQRSDAPAASVPQALRPERWWMPLAAAATIGAIAVGVLQLSSPDKMIEPAHDKAIVSDMPSPPVSTSQTAPTPETASPAAGDRTENRVAPPAPAVAPVAAPEPKGAPALRKDTTPSAATEEQAMKREALVPPSPTGGGRQAGAVDAGKPAPIAEPFPGDVKREAKEKAAGPAASPPASTPAEAPPSGLATDKLKSFPATSARDEAPELPRAPVAQSMAPAAQAPMRRMQDADVARAGAQKSDAANASAGASVDTRVKAQPKLAVADWIALIRRLRDEGKTDDAAKELTAFRAAYPDHERLLPPDLRDWKPVAR
jgi:hypothetical protein